MAETYVNHVADNKPEKDGLAMIEDVGESYRKFADSFPHHQAGNQIAESVNDQLSEFDNSRFNEYTEASSQYTAAAEKKHKLYEDFLDETKRDEFRKGLLHHLA